MPSHLRLQAQFEPVEAKAIHQTSPTLPPAKKQKMSLTQTYFIASTARAKLGKAASAADHDLRLLVGHANLLDGLMLQLAEAEREQEHWFHESIKKAEQPKPSHIQWVDTIPEADEDEDASDEESDDGSEFDEEELASVPLRRMRSPPVEVASSQLEMDFDEEMDDEDDEEHALERSRSHSPPELVDDGESDSEDESMPSSPESEAQDTFELDDKQREAIATTTFYDPKSTQGLEDYIMQQAQQPQAPLIAAY